MAIEVVNRQRLAHIDAGRLAGLADAALSAMGRANEHITVVIVRDRAIRTLNRKYRREDRATDVLSFPTSEAQPGDGTANGTDGRRYLGDIAISIETALRQAQAAGHPLQREVDELVLHGVLHLCGYDHATDRGQMDRIEVKLRRKLLDARSKVRDS